MNKIPVLEIFGPTIQGEGMVIGQKTMFVRTAGCDYSCSWCDSSFTWDGTGKDDIVQMTAEEIWHKLMEVGGDCFAHVTISGGNPALLKNLGELVYLLKEKNIKVALETQGSKWQDWFLQIDELTLSPKPPSSTMRTNYLILDDIVRKLKEGNRAQHVSLKIVVFDDQDYTFAKQIAVKYPELSSYFQVGNEDTQTANHDHLLAQLLRKYEWLIKKTMRDHEVNHVRVLPQLHTFLWGNKRGV
ncbi:7-carboxy-7-deazaguanine synthase QueE [Caldalkalibacillus mannanilyticus]|uniref:7-carboxy-7-deazaguanine synthase QueE n=1 Tax=Caldalkalibacillus mannanilyticus TaxID=1418 RepID=UPI000468B874|nr:7-carboxy-7-deazaguanine synthase QueE [Caldalkalibacillus mannanilyticus]